MFPSGFSGGGTGGWGEPGEEVIHTFNSSSSSNDHFLFELGRGPSCDEHSPSGRRASSLRGN